MTLLPDKLRLDLPAINSQEKTDFDDKLVYAKYFIPDVSWTWFVTEGEPQGSGFVFFGYVINEENEEWRRFNLRELEEVNEKTEELKNVFDVSGLSVELALNFKPQPFRAVITEFRENRN